MAIRSERRARGRAEAQHRSHDRISRRQGDRRAGIRRLCDDSGAEGSGCRQWRSDRNGELEVAQKLNTEVTTAFPVDKAIGALASGVYVMTAEPKEAVAGNGDPIGTASSRSRRSSTPKSRPHFPSTRRSARWHPASM